MRFTSLAVAGSFSMELEPAEDARGFFARMFCQEELQKQGISFSISQVNISHSKKRGTLRGLHYQIQPFEEGKIVQCLRGALFDVIVDLRTDSPTYKKWVGIELSPKNRLLAYVPPGCAHGLMTLQPHTEILYFVSAPYSKEHERGVLWNDPALGIEWPFPPTVLSERDRSHALLEK